MSLLINLVFSENSENLIKKGRMVEDISKTTIAVLLILTILIGVLGTWSVLEATSSIRVGRQPTLEAPRVSTSSGQVAVTVEEPKVSTSKAQIGVTIKKPE
jgi:uncharacterized membrane protein YidH (DUF202 family)